MAVLISKRHKVVLKPPEAIQNAAEDDERRDLLRRFEHHISLPPPVILHSSSTTLSDLEKNGIQNVAGDPAVRCLQWDFGLLKVV